MLHDSINLTTRKTPAPKLLGMFQKRAGKGETYKAKFSEAYQPAGHEFTQSFKILKLAYWLKYDLLAKDDIFVYETLQLLCEMEIPFCLEVLAEKCQIGDATLRKCLDNLENADLLEIYKTDGRGAPNFYLLRTPFFERDAILHSGDERRDFAVDSRHRRIFAAGGELPLTFLEDELPRLRRQIATNRAARLRKIARRKFTKSRLFDRFRRSLDDKKLHWYKLVNRAGSNRAAAEIEGIVYTLAREIPPTDSTYEEFGRRFKEECKRHDIAFSRELLNDAKALCAFFDRYQKPKPTNKAARQESATASIRQYLDTAGESVPMKLFREFLGSLGRMPAASELEALLSERFDQPTVKQILLEMQC